MSITIPKHKNFINGEFLDSDSGKMIQVENPATEKVISEVPESTAADVQNAVEVADKAQKTWVKVPPIERADYLRSLAVAIRENEENLAHTISEEQGKILSLAQIEVNFAADYIDYMAG
ncbi:aldehyde dehydrogenase family protein, partial [Candidatus Poribacteria bacterium]|nr:aldehyde dehydrogenase family protein [Candidatus Poribacteria bacterium]